MTVLNAPDGRLWGVTSRPCGPQFIVRATGEEAVRHHYAAGRVTERLEPDTGPAYFACDEAGNRLMMQDGSGVSYWAYDALDRSFRQEGI